MKNIFPKKGFKSLPRHGGTEQRDPTQLASGRARYTRAALRPCVWRALRRSRSVSVAIHLCRGPNDNAKIRRPSTLEGRGRTSPCSFGLSACVCVLPVFDVGLALRSRDRNPGERDGPLERCAHCSARCAGPRNRRPRGTAAAARRGPGQRWQRGGNVTILRAYRGGRRRQMRGMPQVATLQFCG